MSIIGTFKLEDGVFNGTVRTLTVNAKVRMVPVAEKKQDNSPDYRVIATGCEIGAAWKKTAAETDREYLSVKLDDPSFSSTLYARLVEDDAGAHQLIWTRG